MEAFAAPALASRRLDLEPLCSAHAAALFSGFADAALFRFLDSEAPADVAALERRYAFITRPGAGHPDRWLNWAMRLSGGGDYAGLVEVTLHATGNANLAYFTFSRFMRRGFAREACAAVLDALRDRLGAHEVVATIDVRNVASCRLVETLGFIRADGVVPSTLRGIATLDYHYRLALRRPPVD